MVYDQIQAKPEVPTENESENREWINWNGKCSIKIEEVEICDDDLERNLVDAEVKLESVKFENNSNGYDVTDLTNTENTKDVTQEEISSGFVQGNDKTLKSDADITSDVKECLESVHLQEICYSHPYYKVEAYNDTQLSKHLSNEDSGKSPNKEIYTRKDACEPKKSTKATGKETSLSPTNPPNPPKPCSYTTKTSSRVRCNSSLIHSGIINQGCPHCDYAAKTNILLERHMLKEHRDKSDLVEKRSKMMTGNKISGFKCTLCSYRTKKASDIRKHFDQVHLQIRRFTCPHCDYVATRKFHLNRHIQRRHQSTRSNVVPPEDVLKCTLCPFTCMCTRTMRTHFCQVHLGSLFHCTRCDYVGNCQPSLNRHILRKHEGEPGIVRIKVVCSICEQEFTERGSLQDHIRRVHLNVTKKCSECDYQTMHRGTLRNHILLMHRPENLFRCHNCGYATSRKRTLRGHILQQHVLQHNFKCQYCLYTSKYPKRLRKHIDAQHGKEYPLTCSLCGKEYNGSTCLKKHVKECDQYKSNYEVSLNKHISKGHVIRKKGKEMLVADLEDAILKKPLLIECKNETRTVTRHICDLCETEFISKQSLKNHIITVHF